MGPAPENGTHEMYWNPVERGFLSATLLIIMLASIIGNLLVIITIIRHRGMRTRTNLLLFNMALTDLLSSVFDMPFSLATTIRGEGDFLYSMEWLCMLTGFTTPLFLVASIHTLMYIAVCKLITLRDFNGQWLTKKRIIVFNAAAWAWAVIASALSISGLTKVNHAHYTTQCSPKYPDDVKSWLHMGMAIVTCYAIPGLVIIVCSVWSWKLLQAYNRRMLTTTTLSEKVVYAEQRHTTITTFLVVAAFVVCWTPVVCYAIYAATLHDDQKINHLANPITAWFGYADSACNPIIYAFRSKAFRESYKQVIGRGRRRSSTSSMSTSAQRVHRGSTLSTTGAAVSRNVSGAAGYRTSADGEPSAADYCVALNSSSFPEKDTTATTMMTLLNEYDDGVSGPGNGNGRNEMELMNWTASTANEDEEVARAFGHHHEVDEHGERHQPTALKSYLSVEHLDDIDEHHHHHHHNHHHDNDDGRPWRKKRKFRGGGGSIGGLHRPRDSAEQEEEMVDLASHRATTSGDPAARSRDTVQRQASSSAGAVVNPGVGDSHRPIYRKSTAGAVGDRPVPVTRKPIVTAAQLASPAGTADVARADQFNAEAGARQQAAVRSPSHQQSVTSNGHDTDEEWANRSASSGRRPRSGRTTKARADVGSRASEAGDSSNDDVIGDVTTAAQPPPVNRASRSARRQMRVAMDNSRSTEI